MREAGSSVKAAPQSATAATSCLAAEVASVHSSGKGFSVLAGYCGQPLRVEVCLAIYGLGTLLGDSKVHQRLHRTVAHNMSAPVCSVPGAYVPSTAGCIANYASAQLAAGLSFIPASLAAMHRESRAWEQSWMRC